MARLRVEVVEAHAGRPRRARFELEEGATVRAALAAARRTGVRAVGIHGRRVTLDTPLADGDRVEIYRPLRVDPKEARRQRALRRAR